MQPLGLDPNTFLIIFFFIHKSKPHVMLNIFQDISFCNCRHTPWFFVLQNIFSIIFI